MRVCHFCAVATIPAFQPMTFLRMFKDKTRVLRVEDSYTCLDEQRGMIYPECTDLGREQLAFSISWAWKIIIYLELGGISCSCLGVISRLRGSVLLLPTTIFSFSSKNNCRTSGFAPTYSRHVHPHHLNQASEEETFKSKQACLI